MLDRDFFRREFPQKVQGFSDERESVPVRVVISTVGGRDFDVQRMTSSETGTTLYTREDKMIFLPYGVIEHIQVSVAEDRRVPGFEIWPESDDGTQHGLDSPPSHEHAPHCVLPVLALPRHLVLGHPRLVPRPAVDVRRELLPARPGADRQPGEPGRAERGRVGVRGDLDRARRSGRPAAA